MQQAPPLTHLRGKNRLIARLLGRFFNQGIQLPSDAQKWPSKCVNPQVLSVVPSVSLRNMFESSELEWLVYNAPVDYVNLLLYGDVREYLKNVTEYHPFEN